jgi:hypothetical protein
MALQPPPATTGGGGYTSLSLPDLIKLVEGLGDPSSIAKASQEWDGLGTYLAGKISGQPNADLLRFFNILYPTWKGSGGDAFSQQYLDLLSNGTEVATRASFTPSNRVEADDYSTTFARSTDSAFQALNTLKQAAAGMTPMDRQSAYPAYVNSLDGMAKLQVAYAQRTPVGRELVDQRVDAYAAAANEQKRKQLLGLLGQLETSYSDVAQSLPTKAPGTPPGLSDTSTGVPTNGTLPGLGSVPGPGRATTHAVSTFSKGHVPASTGQGTQLPARTHPAAPPSGQLPGTTSLSGMPTAPNGQTSLAGVHPLTDPALTGLQNMPTSLDPSTHLAGFDPSGVASIAGNPSGLLPLGSLPAGSATGLPGAIAGGLPGGVIPLSSTAGLGPLGTAGLGPLGIAGLGPLGTAGLGSLPTAGLRSLGSAGLEPLDGAGVGAAGLGGAGVDASGGVPTGRLAAGGAVPGETAAELGSGLPAGSAAQRAAAGEGAALAQEGARSGMPMMPYMPMAPMGGQTGQGRERRTWLEEDDDVWSADTALLPPPVIGRSA